MKLISFDIGIKNMAYCLFDIDQSVTKIQEWEVLNLMEDKIQDIKCDCAIAQKKKSLENAKVCGKKAKFQKGQNNYCEKHAKMNKQYIIPVKEISQTALKKMKLDELQALGKTYEIKDIENGKKPEILSKILSYFQENCYEQIKTQKQKSASETDLITIGRNMRDKLDEKSWINDLDVVIMENQISPLAGRMKTVQGMLAQYFIMKSVNNIDFISSSNKLKGFVAKEEEKVNNQSIRDKYKKHKSDSIAICSRFLDGNTELEKWKPCLETPKKDDLADGFLQGIWYLKQNNIITYNADDLKINSV